MASYYDILGVDTEQVFTPEELKRAYRRALLRHHPDKVAGTGNHSNNGQRQVVSVDEIGLAYKTLSDAKLRREYDQALRNRMPQSTLSEVEGRIHRTGLETVDLDSLVFDDAGESWSRSCRCGDDKGFIITEPELEAHADVGEITIGCKGCSLWLRILFSVEG